MTEALQVDLGLLGYAEAWELQKRLVAARKADAIEDVLLFCQHPHVITLGRNGKRENLLASEHVLRQKGVEFHATNRGGDITYHGPGQLVGYPILNLGAIRRDVVWYVRTLEEAMIRTTAEYGITAVREPGKTGVWVEVAESGSSLATHLPASPGHAFTPSRVEGQLATHHSSLAAIGVPGRTGIWVSVAEGDSSPATRLPRASRGHSFTPSRVEGPLATSEKLGAIGVHISRWVTSHGFAYNVSTDLRFFDLIVPCGIADRKATSLEKLLKRSVEEKEVAPRIAKHLAELFGLDLKQISKNELLQQLEHAEHGVPVSA